MELGKFWRWVTLSVEAREVSRVRESERIRLVENIRLREEYN